MSARYLIFAGNPTPTGSIYDMIATADDRQQAETLVQAILETTGVFWAHAFNTDTMNTLFLSSPGVWGEEPWRPDPLYVTKRSSP